MGNKPTLELNADLTASAMSQVADILRTAQGHKVPVIAVKVAPVLGTPTYEHD